MKLNLNYEQFIRMAQTTLDENFYDVRDLYSEYYPCEPISNETLLQFVIDQFKLEWEMKGITLVIR